MATRLNVSTHKFRYYALLSFFTALAAACVLFIPYIIAGEGVMYYYGDFNAQEIPFYQMVHGSIQNGQLGWSYTTNLGCDLLSSYSFYLMGSPFFWITLLFPNSFVPYLIGPLLILKFAFSSLSAFIYLQRYVKNKSFAVLGGILYAFSGFSIYNIFFFHFHEPMIVFPLLLAALDSFLYEKRRGIFALAVFAGCVVNYYFFAGQALFVAIYFLMLALTKTFRFRLKEFFLLALEVIIGFAAAAFILLPSVLGLMGNPRLNSLPNGWNSLVHSSPQRYWLSVLAFLFPADMPAFPVFTPQSNCKWASVAGWLPLFGMTGMIAYLQTRKRDWLKKLITLLMLFAFVPVLNSMFQLLNSSIYYARWYYMLVLLAILATVRAVEDNEVNWNRAIAWSVGLTAGAAALIGFMPNTVENEDGTTETTIGVQATFDRFWIYVLMAMISLLAFVLILKKFHGRSPHFEIASISGVLAVALTVSTFNICTGYLSSSSTETIKRDILNLGDNVKLDGLEKSRCDFYECVDNTAMYWGIQSINCFQSSVSSSIMQFYNALGITRDVASRPETENYGLRALLSCRYLFDYKYDNDNEDCSFTYENGKTKMPYWKQIKTINNFTVYENECYIPMGFVYDSYITQEEFERISTSHRSEAILNAMVLTKEQMEKYSEITGYDKEDYSVLYGEEPDSFESETDSYLYGGAYYTEQCKKLAASSCTEFRYTKTGFEAQYKNDGGESLMFFSVPYSDGFSAKINGKPVQIEKANYGFMAVKLPAQSECNIVFSYETPGFSTGVKISLSALAAFILYMTAVVGFGIRKKKKAELRCKNQEIAD